MEAVSDEISVTSPSLSHSHFNTKNAIKLTIIMDFMSKVNNFLEKDNRISVGFRRFRIFIGHSEHRPDPPPSPHQEPANLRPYRPLTAAMVFSRPLFTAGLLAAAASSASAFAPGGVSLNLRGAARPATSSNLGLRMVSKAEILAPLLESNKKSAPALLPLALAGPSSSPRPGSRNLVASFRIHFSLIAEDYPLPHPAVSGPDDPSGGFESSLRCLQPSSSVLKSFTRGAFVV